MTTTTDVSTPAGGRRRVGRLVRSGAAVAVLGAAALLGVVHDHTPARSTVVVSHGARSRLLGADSPAVRPPVCPTSTHVNAAGQGQYSLAFTAAVTNVIIRGGYNEDHPAHLPKGEVYTPWAFVMSDITGTVCGLVTLPSLTFEVAPAGLSLDGSKAKLNVVLFPFQKPYLISHFKLSVNLLDPLEAAVAGVRPDADGAGPLGAVDAAATAHARGEFSATNPELDCILDVAVPVTTGATTMVPTGRGPGPWTLRGGPVAGGLIGATATLVGNDFPLGPLTPANNPACGNGDSFGKFINQLIGGQDAHGAYYNGPVPEVTAGAPPGEAQVLLSIRLTKVDIPDTTPTAFGPRRG